MEINGRSEHIEYWSPIFLSNGVLLPREPVIRLPRRADTYKSYEERLTGLASLAVDRYNSTHERHFDLVEPVYMQFVRDNTDRTSSNYHLSVIVRSKDSPEKLKLFFAEVCDGIVTMCTPVEPGNPLFPPGACVCCHPLGVIYHPLGRYRKGGQRYRTSRIDFSMTDREKSAKKLLCERYAFKDSVQDLYPDEDKRLRESVKRYAQKALARYALLMNRVFELSEVVASVRFSNIKACTSELDAITWVHVNFKARDPLCIDASPQLFFAELNLDFGWVNVCTNMTQDDFDFSKSEAETSCAMCRKFCPMFHPEGGYSAGRQGGTFADAQVKDRSWGAKVELLEKVGTSSNADGVQVGKLDTCSSNEK